MTWREKRIISFLSGILALLALALLLVLSARYRTAKNADEAEGPAGEEVVDQVENRYNAIVYHNGTTTLSFALGEHNRWYWVDDTSFPLNQDPVNEICTLVSSLRPSQTITVEESLANFGLDSPSASLTATAPDGAALTLELGNNVSGGEGRYAMVNGNTSTLYVIDPTLTELMSTPIYDMMILPELPVLTEENLRTISICGFKETDIGTQSVFTILSAQREEGASAATWYHGETEVTDHRLVQDLLTDLKALSFERCLIYRPSEEALEFCGFKNPIATLSVFYYVDEDTTKELDLIIANRLEDESGRYVRLEGSYNIYTLPTELLDPLLPMAMNGMHAGE